MHKNDLEKSNPEFTHIFVDEFLRTNDFSQAVEKARPMLHGELSESVKLQTLILDFELALDKTRRALNLISTPPPSLGSDWSTGAWTTYNLDQWTFQFAAWLERLHKLQKRICRVLIKQHNVHWKKIENELSQRIQQMKNYSSKVRDPLAHGGGGGVTGPEEERLLDYFPLIPNALDIDIVSFFYESFDTSQQQKWSSLLRTITTKALAESEAIFKELNRYSFELGQSNKA